MVVLQQIRVGRSVSLRARSNAASSMAGIVTVHSGNDVPAARFKTGGRVVAEPLVDVAIDGNAVVVIHDDELAEAESPGEGTGLLRQPFHEAAVARNTYVW